MERGFTNKIIQSSHIDDNNRSEIEDPKTLSAADIEKTFNIIPSWTIIRVLFLYPSVQEIKVCIFVIIF